MSGPARGDVAVCVPAGGEDTLRRGTLESLRAHTPDGVPILDLDPGADPLTVAAPADVVIVQPGCVVAEGWLDGLRCAAAPLITATATALTQHDLDPGTVLDPAGLSAAAAAVRAGSLRLRPRVAPTDTVACRYVRRPAIELVGAGPGFARRCLEHGLAHVLADDVLVLDGRRSTAAPSPTAGGEPVARALGAARRGLRGLTVVIDAGILYGPITGTRVHVLELIASLARTGALELTVMVPDEPNDHAQARLAELPGVTLLSYEQISRPGAVHADVVHRPFQLSNAGDLPFLRSLGERLILTQQDLIAFHNPAYFPSPEAWEGYRRLTRLALATADRVLFFSAHARDEALAEELLAPASASVVHIGADHPLAGAAGAPAPVPPAGAERLTATAPVILCLGTDFHHKNRRFALRVVAELRRRHGWQGVLAFAGPPMAHGSSREQEAGLLSADPELAGAVIDFGPVSEAEKRWLFERSTLVLYPSVVEGFGLVPFEAAAHRVPCLWAPGSSLSELLPDAAAAITPWNEELTAERAVGLLHDQRARAENLAAIDGAASDLTWDATARALLEVYRAAADAPSRGAVAAPAGLAGLSEDAARLVGPGGVLPAEVERPLLAVATHRRIAAPVFGALKLGYRAAYELRRRRRSQTGSQSRR